MTSLQIPTYLISDINISINNAFARIDQFSGDNYRARVIIGIYQMNPNEISEETPVPITYEYLNLVVNDFGGLQTTYQYLTTLPQFTNSTIVN